MRIPLRTKVTLTLVAFGLIPAGIVAAFAYMSAQDFMGRQRLLIRQAAAAISDHAKLLVLKNNELEHKGEKESAEGVVTLQWKLTVADLEELQTQISMTLDTFKLPNAVVTLIDPSNNVILQRTNTGYITSGKLNPEYEPYAEHANARMDTEAIDARSDPTYKPAEIVGYAPVTADPENGTSDRMASSP